MANRNKIDTSKIVVNNPLLSPACNNLVLESLRRNGVLLPVTHNSPSVLSEDVGEVDSFLGQDTPNSTLPSVIGFPSSLSTSSTTSTSVSSLPLWSSPSSGSSFFSSQQQLSPAVSHSPFEQISNPPSSSYTPSSLISGISASPLLPANQSHLPTTRVPPSSTPVLQVAPVASPSNVSSIFSSPSSSGRWNYQQPFAVISTTTAPVTSSNLTALDTTTNTTPVLSLSPSSIESRASPSAASPPFGSFGFQPFVSSPVCVKKVITPPPLASSHHFQPGFKNSSTGPLVAPPIATVAPIADSTNTYRRGSQKKPLYAQPPGLSLSTPVITSYEPSTIESYSPTPAAVAPPLVQSTAASMATQTAAATLTPLQLPSPTPTQYQSSVAAIGDSNRSTATSYANLGQPTHMYRQVYHHWFYKKEVESKVIWQPFSMADSLALEKAFTSTDISPETVVATDGGRYDVNILRRQRTAVYWQENPTEVRRCSWFYKGPSDTRYVPYEENISTKLEEEFRIATTTNLWHRHIELPNGEAVVFHGPGVMVHFLQPTSPDAWSNTPQTQVRPRVVKRGVDEFDIDEGEPPKIDHLLFLVHGIGSVCDLKFRSVEEVVDDFRSLALQLVQSHFHTAQEQGLVNRIEVLPISWHATLHGEDTGIDRKLKAITLKSIPKLRHFTNDTLLDILFYTSPVYCQTIVNTVGKELNRLYSLFCQRNPNFQGGVSVGGHSLGSLILFDLLYHQKPVTEEEPLELETSSRESSEEPVEENVGKVKPSQRKLNQRVSYVVGNAGTGQPFITYPQLTFQPKTFYALGSPIGMFVTVRGIDTLGEDFCLPTCPGFFNIFHPFDPVAYRIETLVNSELTDLRPVLIPHHKGRKRMHLELKETMARVGADLKQKLVESIRSTWNTVYQLAMFHRTDDQLEQEVDKVLEEQIKQQQETDGTSGTDADADLDVCVGQLNGGRRIDYVLQEAPLESFNEYLFAMKTHVCYWESEDTMLMILKEIYSMMGISADSQVPMQSTSRTPADSATLGGMEDIGLRSQSEPQTNTYTLDVQGTAAYLTSPQGMAPPPFSLRSTSVPAVNQQMNLGMDPTAPMSENKNLGPPPISGFVKKS